MWKSGDIRSKAVLMVEGLITIKLRKPAKGKAAFCSVFRVSGETSSFGDMGGEGTPGSISNPAVKLSSADGTVLVTGRKSRSLPKELVFLTP